MKKQLVKDTIELVGAVAIVASFIFLAIETRTNTASVRATAYQTWVSVNSQLNTVDQELSSIIAVGTKDTRNLNEDNFIRFAMWHNTFMQMAVATNYMYKMGVIDEELWKSEINRAAGHLELKGVRQWWDAGARTQFNPEFVALMESTKSTIIRWDFDPDNGFVPNKK